MFDEPKAVKAQQRAEEDAAREKEQMLKTIEQLTMERDFLKAVKSKQTENRRLL